MALKTIEAQTNKKYDWLKWLVVIFLLITGLIANYHYNYQPWPLRLLGWLFLLAVMAAIVFQTRQGKQVIDIARESRMELRKVFWPTRQETIQTTIFVAIMVVVLALILWGIDSVLMWLIGWLTGQRG
jgi:preprotein translocase subunit SecE